MYGSYDPFGLQSPYFGDPFSSPYDRRRRQEMARRQRMMEEERRRKAEYERRRRVEERLALEEQQRRREMEMMQRERTMAKQKQRQRLQKKQTIRSAGSYPPGTIVRGPDGNLYRVVAPTGYDRNSSMGSFSDSTSDIESNCSTENKENEVEGPTSQGISSIKTKSKKLDNDDGTNSKTTTNVTSMQTKQEPLDQILVENVPDDEDEELKELHSVWRNRIPSPGQWMEPVESFCGSRQ